MVKKNKEEDKQPVLEDLLVYQKSMDVGDLVWNVVAQWDFFAKDTVGKQIVKSADSIAANIAEGYGRYHYRDRRQFMYYSRGSLLETKCWLSKCLRRKLVTQDEHDILIKNLKEAHYLLNKYIHHINQQMFKNEKDANNSK